ncbi:hypothetical protein NKI82_24035 [Mesorhizobium sp. M0482]|uniref:hypothetical protein n=1 Tax=Mesorhizobium sp. M0482 TaxID=2956948 RepID=UPI0033358CA5
MSGDHVNVFPSDMVTEMAGGWKSKGRASLPARYIQRFMFIFHHGSNYAVPKVPRIEGRSYPVSTDRTALDNMASGRLGCASELHRKAA